MYKRPETATTCPNKQFWSKTHLFFLPICQEEINKVIFVWVYELENNIKSAQFVSCYSPNIQMNSLGSSIWYVRKIFWSCAYNGVRNVSFSENFVYVLNGWSPKVKKIRSATSNHQKQSSRGILCSVKNLVSNISQNSQESTCAGVTF